MRGAYFFFESRTNRSRKSSRTRNASGTSLTRVASDMFYFSFLNVSRMLQALDKIACKSWIFTRS
jgi:hypothetical protein